VQQKPAKSSINFCGPEIWRRSVDAVVELETRILAKNDALAAKNRAWFAGREILALNDGERMPAAGAGRRSIPARGAILKQTWWRGASPS
jgi:hypothetical protein